MSEHDLLITAERVIESLRAQLAAVTAERDELRKYDQECQAASAALELVFGHSVGCLCVADGIRKIVAGRDAARAACKRLWAWAQPARTSLHEIHGLLTLQRECLDKNVPDSLRPTYVLVKAVEHLLRTPIPETGQTILAELAALKAVVERIVTIACQWANASIEDDEAWKRTREAIIDYDHEAARAKP